MIVEASSSVPPTLRFGVFELDPRAGELRKKGMKVRLQGQPVEILVMLLEGAGEIITREELQQKLWSADTFVDFEQGLNNAMNRRGRRWMTMPRVLISSRPCPGEVIASSGQSMADPEMEPSRLRRRKRSWMPGRTLRVTQESGRGLRPWVYWV